jgi:hypothetical protein
MEEVPERLVTRILSLRVPRVFVVGKPPLPLRAGDRAGFTPRPREQVDGVDGIVMAGMINRPKWVQEQRD